MPNRVVREGILDSRPVNSLSEEAELFYRRLMSIVDDYGRFTADPELIRARCFPLQLDRWPLSRVRRVLADVSHVADENGFPLVLIYEVGSKSYIEIGKFDQRLRVKKPKYPEPSVRHKLDARQTDDGHVTVIRPLESEVESESESEGEVESEVPRHPKTEQPPDFTLSDWAECRYALHPKKGHKHAALRNLSEISGVTDPEWRKRFEEKHNAWIASDDWRWKGGAKAPWFDEWILDEGYLYDPPTPTPDAPKGGIDYAKIQRELDEEFANGKRV